MSDEKLKEYEAKLESERKEKAKLEAENAKLKAEEESRKKEFSRKQKEDREKTLKTFCEDQVKAKKITPAQRDVIVDGTSKAHYSDNDGYFISFDTLKEFVEKGAKVKIDEKERGKHKRGEGDKTAGEQIHEFTIKKVAESSGNLTYDQAMSFVMQEHKDLADEWAKGGDE